MMVVDRIACRGDRVLVGNDGVGVPLAAKVVDTHHLETDCECGYLGEEPHTLQVAFSVQPAQLRHVGVPVDHRAPAVVALDRAVSQDDQWRARGGRHVRMPPDHVHLELDHGSISHGRLACPRAQIPWVVDEIPRVARLGESALGERVSQMIVRLRPRTLPVVGLHSPQMVHPIDPLLAAILDGRVALDPLRRVRPSLRQMAHLQKERELRAASGAVGEQVVDNLRALRHRLRAPLAARAPHAVYLVVAEAVGCVPMVHVAFILFKPKVIVARVELQLAPHVVVSPRDERIPIEVNRINDDALAPVVEALKVTRALLHLG
mmetsp:Transcript_42458/g.111759  ORF Transcript_42458/g.111759 Transcript_42458/m.111759 type:complete len:320 (-) Transcript_42458:1156-2115(-)